MKWVARLSKPTESANAEDLTVALSTVANENGDGPAAECTVRCVTEHGLLLETEALALGDRIELGLPSDDEVTATVVWKKGRFTGCDFDRPVCPQVLESLPAIPEPDSPETLGRRLRRLRTERGLEQTDLAGRLGVSKVTVWNWEKDKSRPRTRSLETLAELFGCSVRELLLGEQNGASTNGAETPLGEALESYKSEIARLAGARPQDVAITISFAG